MKKYAFPLLFFTIFIDMFGIGILLPVIPVLIADPSSPYYLLTGPDPRHGYIILGFLVAIYPFMQFLSTPILGQLSDKYGRKKILGLSLFGTAFGYLLFAVGIVTRNIPLLFLSRGLDGITGGNVSVAQAAIADITKPENRAKNFGLIGVAFGLGFILGPVIGAKISDSSIVSWFNASTPFLFTAILAFLNGLFVVFLLPETLAVFNRDKIVAWTKSIKNIMRAYSLKALRPLYATNFFFQGGFSFFTTFFSVFLIERFSFTETNIGTFFAYMGLWIAFSQAVVTRLASRSFKESTVIRVSMIVLGLVIFTYFLPQERWGLYVITPFFAIFMGLSLANIPALISRSADPTIQGEILGINASVQSLAQSIPPILSGYIAATLASHSPILVSGIVLIAAGIIFNIFYRPLAQPVKI